MAESRPCVMCDGMLKPAMDDWETLQPHGGGEIRLVFSYGSQRFDECMGITEYKALICDSCASALVPRMSRFTDGSFAPPTETRHTIEPQDSKPGVGGYGSPLVGESILPDDINQSGA